MQQLNVSDLLRALQIVERNVSVTLMYSGLRIPQFRLLELLDECGQGTVTEVSNQLNITRATASVQINELIRSGIVAVVENESDRRSFHVAMTELGINKLNVARNDLAVMQQELNRHYSGEMISVLNAFAAETLKGRH
ncbi:MAG: MarR family transcriptional regulator [Gammaproteobacteria bacterium]|nr:MarR family transcriptional regulator [Gammaproteobacteria bacterium]